MKVRAEESDEPDDVEDILGPGGSGEYSFLLVPKEAYSVVLQQARKEGCSAGVIFQKAIVMYLESNDPDHPNARDGNKAQQGPEPAVFVRRKR